MWAPTHQIASTLSADASPACLAGTLELKASKEGAHSSAVMSVTYSPDGKTIVSGSSDQTIKVWGAAALSPVYMNSCSCVSVLRTDATTLSLVASQTDSSAGFSRIQSVGYSPDGSKIVSGAYSGTLKVWDSGER